MSRAPILRFVFVATLAVLLPVEWAHCVWMGLQGSAPVAVVSAQRVQPAPPAPGHECCAPDAAARDANDPASAPSEPQACYCQFLPVLAPSVATIKDVAPATSFPVVCFDDPIAILEPVSISKELPLPLDVGPPSGLPDLGAHGLRAPPISA